eukprot:1146808-Amphidinium_carterae.1
MSCGCRLQLLLLLQQSLEDLHTEMIRALKSTNNHFRCVSWRNNEIQIEETPSIPTCVASIQVHSSHETLFIVGAAIPSRKAATMSNH